MKKAKHEPTTKRLTVLLLKLQDFQFDLQNTIDYNSDLSNIDSSKLLTTYQSPSEDLYNKEKPLITQDTQRILLHSHIPQQSELDRFLKNNSYINI